MINLKKVKEKINRLAMLLRNNNILIDRTIKYIKDDDNGKNREAETFKH